MKLAAIYNVWDGVELLPGSMRCLKGSVDLFIIVYQTVSNYGEHFNPLTHPAISEVREEFDNIEITIYNPPNTKADFAAKNETAKRNKGINLARQHGCTHFILMDCDEYYENFSSLVKEYEKGGSAGSVCPIYTYFREPTLRFKELDNYYVPFIHRLDADTQTGFFPYPHYVDPTRRINCKEEVKILKKPMHHFSWVRHDINRKIQNSTARKNIVLSTLLEDYKRAEPGLMVSHYNNQKLIRVGDIFNLTDVMDE